MGKKKRMEEDMGVSVGDEDELGAAEAKHMKDTFQIEDPGPEPSEEELDGLREEAQGKERQEPREEEVATPPKPAGESAGEAVRASEAAVPQEPAEKEPTAEEKLAVAEESASARLAEISRLRSELQSMKREQGQSQPPVPQQAEAATQPPQAPDFEFDFEMTDDGKMRATEESKRAFRAYNESRIASQVQAATQVDPQVEFERVVESETQRWVAGDPEKFQSAQRIRQAAQDMELMAEHYIMSTGHKPQGIEAWVQTIASTEMGQKFAAMYPEVTDIGSFLDTFLVPGETGYRVWKAKRYMDNMMSARTQEHGNTVPGASSSNVVQLSSNRPRSMAEKGRGMDQGTTKQAEFDGLVQKLGTDPLQMDGSHDAEKQRMKELARELKIHVGF